MAWKIFVILARNPFSLTEKEQKKNLRSPFKIAIKTEME